MTKISIGIQSFFGQVSKILGRKTVDTAAMAATLAAVPLKQFQWTSSLPAGQTFEDLRADIDAAFSLGANHVAIYPFIDFTFTDSSVAAMPKREKRELLDAITRYCMSRGYPRSSIWTFSNEPNASYSSMTRDNFLGFGCSATSLFKEQFKINTFDVDSYCERIRSGRLATALTLRFTRRQRMVYWLFWTAYSTRVNADDFEAFFGVPLKKMYGMELWLAKRLGFVTEHGSIRNDAERRVFLSLLRKIFTRFPISTRCGASCARKHFPNPSSCKNKTACAQTRRGRFSDACPLQQPFRGI